MRNPDNLMPKALAEKKYKSSRNNFLLMLGFTVLNVILLIFNSGVMMLFSATIPYYAIALGMMAETTGQLVFFLSLGIGMIVAYLICFIFSKKHYGFMIAALVLFVIDTVALIGLYTIALDVSGIIDLAIHAWVMYYLITGIINGYKLRHLPDDPEIEEILPEPFDAPEVKPGDSKARRLADTNVKARILLETEALGKKIVYRRIKNVNELVIDGYVYDEFEALVEGAHSLSATVDGVLFEVGYDGGTQSYAKVNGEKIAKKTRIW